MRVADFIPLFVLLAVAIPAVYTQTCDCPDRYAADGVTKCTKTIALNPCSCSYRCVSLPVCNFDSDQARCLSRSVNGSLICRFSITDRPTCATKCVCSSVSTSPSKCNFTAPRADCMKKDPACVFTKISETNCQSSCSCPVKPPPCDFTAQQDHCKSINCELTIRNSNPGSCSSQCNCTYTSSNSSINCNTVELAKYQTECNAKPNCLASIDMMNCQSKCNCYQNSTTIEVIPATCDYNDFKNRCLSRSGCNFSLVELTNCNLLCTCPSIVTGACDVAFYRNRCLSTPGAFCTFLQPDPNSCDLSCQCIKQ